MKQAILPNQKGAVLIFTLLMLLLLTLSGVSMIEQNKQQIAMMRNSRQQNQTLARAEQLLAQAENAIKNANEHQPCLGTSSSPCVNSDPSPSSKGFTCTPDAKSDGSLVQTPLLAGSRPAGLPTEATILSVSCLIDTANTGSVNLIEKLCSTYDQTTAKTYCYPPDPDSPSDIDKEVCVTDTTPKIPDNGDDSWACYKKFQTEIPMARCPTEIYTIQVTSVDEDTGSKRTIESKYAVACH
jgi:Tfp pilus assembly protein PilX